MVLHEGHDAGRHHGAQRCRAKKHHCDRRYHDPRPPANEVRSIAWFYRLVFYKGPSFLKQRASTYFLIIAILLDRSKDTNSWYNPLPTPGVLTYAPQRNVLAIVSHDINSTRSRTRPLKKSFSFDVASLTEVPSTSILDMDVPSYNLVSIVISACIEPHVTRLIVCLEDAVSGSLILMSVGLDAWALNDININKD